MKFRITLLIVMLYVTATGQPRTIPGEVLVQFRPCMGAVAEGQLATVDGFILKERLSRHFNIWLCTYDTKRLKSGNALKSIRQNKNVLNAQEHHFVAYRESIPNDRLFGSQWALLNTGTNPGLPIGIPGADIQATWAWDITDGAVTRAGDSVIVAQVDGGIDYSHTDINVWRNRGEIPGDGIDNDNNGYVDDYWGWDALNKTPPTVFNSHGTGVASVSAAKTNNNFGVAGVAPGTKVVNVVGSALMPGSESEATVVRAYDYIYNLRKIYNESSGALGAYVVAVNSSFGVEGGKPEDYPIWSLMYDSLATLGILNVASTLNRRFDIDLVGDVPSSMSNESLLTVTSTTNTDILAANAAFGYQTIDLGAPGNDIYVAYPGNLFGIRTGTSFAAPHVTGTLALMYGAADRELLQQSRSNPELVALKMKQYLLASVDSLPTLNLKTVSGGRLNAYKAVQMALFPPQLTSNTDQFTFTLKKDSTADSVFTVNSLNAPFALLQMSSTGNLIRFPVMADTIRGTAPREIRFTVDTQNMAEGAYSEVIAVQDNYYNRISIPVTIEVKGLPVPVEIFRDTMGLFPNPNKGNFSVKYGLVTPENVLFRITDMAGKVIWEEKSNYQTLKNFSLPHLKPGTYNVTLVTSKSKLTRKFVKL